MRAGRRLQARAKAQQNPGLKGQAMKRLHVHVSLARC